MRILDLGSGPGTGLIGTSLFFQGKNVSLEMTAIDQNPSVLRDAAILHEKTTNYLNLHSRLRLITADLTHRPLASIIKEKFDLILILNTLNEFFTRVNSPMEKRFQIVTRLLKNHLTDSGKILIVEPALRKTTLELMELHDEILKTGTGSVLAPCLHQQACPMLKENRRDWCHTYLEWKRPPMIEEFDQRIGIRKDYLKCSYLLLAKPEALISMDPKTSAEESLFHQVRSWSMSKDPEKVRLPVWRVVSSLMKSNGKREVVLCGEAAAIKGNLLHTERLDRDRSEMNYPFDNIKRGDILSMPPVTRITQTTQVKILTTFS